MFIKRDYKIIYNKELIVYHIPYFTFLKTLNKNFKIAKNYGIILFKFLNSVNNKNWIDIFKIWIYPLVFYSSLLGVLLFLFLKNSIFLFPGILILSYFSFIFIRAVKRYTIYIKQYSKKKYLIIFLLFIFNLIERIIFAIFFLPNYFCFKKNIK